MPLTSATQAAITKTVLNTVAVIAIAYVFIVVLMTAAAQQRVSAILEQRNGRGTEAEQIDYSTAWAKVQAAKETRKSIPDLRTDLAGSVALAEKARAAVVERGGAFDDAWSEFVPQAQFAAERSADACGTPQTSMATPKERVDYWKAFKACIDLESQPKAIKTRLATVLDGPNTVGALYPEVRASLVNLDRANADWKSVNDRLAEANAALAEAAELSAAFNVMDVLSDNWKFGRGVFIDVPPPLMQILLAFFSGLFGALLVTLVLVVYPKTELSASAGTENASRILLGGLISLGVYIIMGGGSAVLGGATPFDESKANYLTFCAIGVLAGMFSDRVAFWLSDRANAFFASGSRPPTDAPKPVDESSSDSKAEEHAYG